MAVSNKQYSPPNIRREQSLIRECTKSIKNLNQLIHTDLRSFNDTPSLKSCKPSYLMAKEIIRQNLHPKIK